MRVPQYQPDSISPTGMPDVRFNQQAPLDAFGGSAATADAFGMARGMAQDSTGYLVDKMKEAQKQADDDAMTQARVALNDFERQQKTDAQSKRGVDALNTTSTLDKALQKFTSDYETKLATPEQKSAYRAMAAARRDYLLDWGSGYEKNARDEVHVGGLKASTASSMERAAADPSTVGLESKIVDDNTRKLAQFSGFTPEQTQEARREAQSSLHFGVLNRMLASGNELDAKLYYDAHKDQFVGQEADRAAAVVRHGSVAAEAAKAVDDAWTATTNSAHAATGGGDESELRPSKPTFETEKDAVDAVKAMTAGMDQSVIDQATERAIKRFQLEKLADKQTTDKIYQDSSKLLDQPQNRGKIPQEVIPPDQWSQLSLQEKDNLMVYAAKLMKPTAVSDPKTMTYFDSLSDAQLMKMSQADMLKFLTSPKEGFGAVSQSDYENKILPKWRAAIDKNAMSEFKVTPEDEKEIFRRLQASTAAGDMSKIKSLNDLLKPHNRDLNESYRKAHDELYKILETAADDKPMKRLNQKERDQAINDYVIDKTLKNSEPTIIDRITRGLIYGAITAPVGIYSTPAAFYGASYNPAQGSTPNEQERKDIEEAISAFGGTISEQKVRRMKYAQEKGASLAMLKKLATE